MFFLYKRSITKISDLFKFIYHFVKIEILCSGVNVFRKDSVIVLKSVVSFSEKLYFFDI